MGKKLNQFAHRTSHLEQEGAYAVLSKAQTLETQGHDIIHLEIGQPDSPTFTNISLAGIRAITNGQTRYSSPAGIPALRAAIDRRGRMLNLVLPTELRPRSLTCQHHVRRGDMGACCRVILRGRLNRRCYAFIGPRAAYGTS